MKIPDFKTFFKKKIPIKNTLPEDEIFNVENFNDWLCNKYKGNDDYKGKDIFKRFYRLSQPIIESWFNFLNIDYKFDDIMKMMDLIKKNWIKLRLEE